MIHSKPVQMASAIIPARIGPNSLIQTVRALQEQHADCVRAILQQTDQLDLLDHEPTAMVDERAFEALVGATASHIGIDPAGRVLHVAGRYTADYLLAHRIPRFFQRLLKILPGRLALPLLLIAISKHAWTFVGSGVFSYTLRGTPEIRVHCHVVPGRAAYRFYGGAMEHLIHTLVDPRAQVTMAADKQSADQTLCRYVVQFRN